MRFVAGSLFGLIFLLSDIGVNPAAGYTATFSYPCVDMRAPSQIRASPRESPNRNSGVMCPCKCEDMSYIEKTRLVGDNGLRSSGRPLTIPFANPEAPVTFNSEGYGKVALKTAQGGTTAAVLSLLFPPVSLPSSSYNTALVRIVQARKENYCNVESICQFWPDTTIEGVNALQNIFIYVNRDRNPEQTTPPPTELGAGKTPSPPKYQQGQDLTDWSVQDLVAKVKEWKASPSVPPPNRASRGSSGSISPLRLSPDPEQPRPVSRSGTTRRF
ncbi:hypothetical protein EX30DRAFT_365483 [Ascodesmis nigricans]|uniref:Uncharacterized protein n=1 Tax=Ascodesmis nigricans TaxID=341454 RepID=A0A4S2MSN0_9PEZI|nr:hypothetical protein EX30DRAFT_365483 [Ascodesmis nigricans]